MEIKTHIEKISEERKSSFWYDGHIASIDLDNGNTLITETSGCIEVSFAIDSPTFKDGDAVTEAYNLGLVDTDLENCIEHDGFSFNNWFRFVELDANGETVNDDFLNLEYYYDDAIETLKNLAETLK